MQTKYSDDVQFLFIYCREAHPIDGDRPTGKEVEQPVSTQERREVAVKFLDEMELNVPALLDNIDDKTSKDYVSHPDRLYLVGKDGKIAYGSGKGPRGFDPDELEEAIQQELTGSKRKGDGNPQVSQIDRRVRRLNSMPVFAAINKNGDAELSRSEIESAPQSLVTLDKNGDGELTADELRPARSRR